MSTTSDPKRWAILLACASGALLAPLGAHAERASASATAKAKAKKPAADTVAIAAGCVTVGPAEAHGDLAPRKVCLKAFRIDRTEVTVAQHRACVTAGACTPPPKRDPRCNANANGRDQHPANCATYEEAVRFCKWRGARLPSPDEWERAARGPKMTLYPWGAQAPTKELVAFPQLAGGHRHDLTTEPVCSHPSGNSAEGACDLAGNVAEWVAGYFADRGPVPTHPGAALGPFGKNVELDGSRWSRGGSFASPAASLQSWDADEADLDEEPDAKRGFRCATGG